MSICEDRITEDSTEFEKAFLKIYDGSLWTALDKMKYWQPPKPLVKVPQCVDDAIKALPKYHSVYSAINFIRDKVNENEHWLDVYEWIFRESNVNEFARALLDDYTVEKQQLYEVVFYVDEEDDRCLLMKTGKTISFEYESQNKGHYQQQFTEAEIKAIDARYLAFSVPV